MGRTASLETVRRWEQHAKSVKIIDEQLKKYNLRFLESMPDHLSVLMDKNLEWGVDMGIRAGRKVLQALTNNKITERQVLTFIVTNGKKYLK